MQITVIKEQRKTATIRIKENHEILVKVPYCMTQQQIDQLLIDHQQWIKEQSDRKQQQRALNDWWLTGKQLYMGRYWEVRKKVVHGVKPALIFNQNLGFVLMTNGTEEMARREMKKFYKKRTMEIVMPMVQKYAQLMNVEFSKVTIREQLTRWGSCSSRGNLSFNMKIICAPLEAVEYVVLHEVAHLKHFNHSKVFWQEVEKWMPNYKVQVNYFKQFGQNFII